MAKVVTLKKTVAPKTDKIRNAPSSKFTYEESSLMEF